MQVVSMKRNPVALLWLDPFFRRMTVSLLITFALLSTATRNCKANSNRSPNIVLILADDLGFSDLGCYGSEIATPNIDGLFKEGMLFTHFYNAARSCPTRASLLTGLYPHETGVGHMMNDWKRPGYKGNLNRECVTLAEILGEAGYQTRMVGKWHLSRHIGPKGPTHAWPRQRGFQRFFGTIQGAGSYFDPATLLRENYPAPATGDFYYTEAISRQAVEDIGEATRRNAPFFLYVAYTAPHWPLQVRPEGLNRYRARYGMGWDEVRIRRHQRMIQFGLVERQWPLTTRDIRVPDWSHAPHRNWQERRMEAYAAQVEAMDRGIGLILKKLHQTGCAEKTLVLFLSDNGGCAEEISRQWQGSHIPTHTRDGYSVQIGNNPSTTPGPETTYQSYGLGWANASNTPFSGYKHEVYEGGIATPLIVRWPKVIRSKRQISHAVGHVVDIVPTCCEATGVKYPSHYQGRKIRPTRGQSLLPLLKGETRQRGPIFWEHEGNRAVRDGKWKVVAKHRGDWQLFDMETDRTETNDLAQQFPAILEYMEKLYHDWAKRSNVLPWPK